MKNNGTYSTCIFTSLLVLFEYYQARAISKYLDKYTRKLSVLHYIERKFSKETILNYMYQNITRGKYL